MKAEAFVVLFFCIYATSDSHRILVVHQRNLKEKNENYNLKAKTIFDLHQNSSGKIENSKLIQSRNSQSTDHDNSDIKKQHINKHDKNKKKALWRHCADGSTPKEVQLSRNPKGTMCQREYPSKSCCTNFDLTFDLLGSKVS